MALVFCPAILGVSATVHRKISCQICIPVLKQCIAFVVIILVGNCLPPDLSRCFYFFVTTNQCLGLHGQDENLPGLTRSEVLQHSGHLQSFVVCQTWGRVPKRVRIELWFPTGDGHELRSFSPLTIYSRHRRAYFPKIPQLWKLQKMASQVAEVVL